MQTTKTPHQHPTWNTTPVGLLLLKHPKLQKRYLLTDDPDKSASAKFHNSKVSQSRDGSKKFKEVVPIFLRHLTGIYWHTRRSNPWTWPKQAVCCLLQKTTQVWSRHQASGWNHIWIFQGRRLKNSCRKHCLIIRLHEKNQLLAKNFLS
jgi:hypothetical protein